jgi:hypothetical protein
MWGSLRVGNEVLLFFFFFVASFRLLEKISSTMEGSPQLKNIEIDGPVRRRRSPRLKGEEPGMSLPMNGVSHNHKHAKSKHNSSPRNSLGVGLMSPRVFSVVLLLVIIVGLMAVSFFRGSTFNNSFTSLSVFLGKKTPPFFHHTHATLSKHILRNADVNVIHTVDGKEPTQVSMRMCVCVCTFTQIYTCVCVCVSTYPGRLPRSSGAREQGQEPSCPARPGQRGAVPARACYARCETEPIHVVLGHGLSEQRAAD